MELAPLRVNAVKPGVVRSPLWRARGHQTLTTRRRGSCPSAASARPTDIAEAYVYLMNQGYATGTILTVDGGHVLV